MNSLIQGFKERREGDKRIIECGICGSSAPRSIVPHMKLHHPGEWSKWVDRFVELRLRGASFKEIMWDFDRLFSWTVIRRELSFHDPLLFNRIKIREWVPVSFKLEETTMWRFPTRGKWANHTHHYPGNWAPQVPRNLILRYSKVGETVLDPFVGGGTTLIECLLLGRNGIGADINPKAVEITKLRIRELRAAAKRQNYPLSNVNILVRRADARNLSFINDNTIDLVCAHPPYMDSIRYTKWSYEDLSRTSNVDEYVTEIRKVLAELHRVLKKGGICAFMLGDVRKGGKLIPLGFRVFQAFEREGFKVNEMAIKEQEHCSLDEFYRGKNDGFLKIGHEYILTLHK